MRVLNIEINFDELLVNVIFFFFYTIKPVQTIICMTFEVDHMIKVKLF